MFSDVPEADNRRNGVQGEVDQTEGQTDVSVTERDFLDKQGKPGKTAGDKAAGVDKGIDVKSHEQGPDKDEADTLNREKDGRIFRHRLTLLGPELGRRVSLPFQACP
jgi:hypothetical protein